MKKKESLSAEPGFSLLEALFALLILTVLSLFVLQALGRLVQAYRAERRRGQAAIELWNRTQTFRSTPLPASSQSESGLRRMTIKDPNTGLTWEVWHGR